MYYLWRIVKDKPNVMKYATVLDIARELEDKRNELAVTLRKQSTRTIGIAIPQEQICVYWYSPSYVFNIKTINSEK